MRFIILLILSLFVITSTVPVNAQTSGILVFSQIALQDSKGNFVTSFEATKIGYINEVALNNFLNEETLPTDKVLNVNGQNIQIIQRISSQTFESNNVVSDTTLNIIQDDGKILTLVRLIHDGVPVISGDELTVIWTFIRPL